MCHEAIKRQPVETVLGADMRRPEPETRKEMASALAVHQAMRVFTKENIASGGEVLK